MDYMKMYSVIPNRKIGKFVLQMVAMKDMERRRTELK